MFDIIFFAILSYFLFKKLKSILGEEYDDEFFGYNAKSSKKKNKIKDAEKVNTNDNLFDGFEYLSNEAKKNTMEIAELIEKQGGNFTLKSFHKIVIKVFETTIEANNNQDEKTIKQFFAPKLANLTCQTFNQNIKNNIVLVSIKNTTIKDILKEEDKKFVISVAFETEQINYTTNDNEEVIEGSKQIVEPVNEVWYFSHDFTTNNLTWFVEKIEEN